MWTKNQLNYSQFDTILGFLIYSLTEKVKTYISRLLDESEAFVFDWFEILIFGGHAARQPVNDLSQQRLASNPVHLNIWDFEH